MEFKLVTVSLAISFATLVHCSFSPLSSSESTIRSSVETSEYVFEKREYYNRVDSEFVTVEDLLKSGLEGGDLIECKRFLGAYDHWGVYIGNKFVIHMMPNGEDGNPNPVRKDQLDKISGMFGCRVNNLEAEAKAMGLSPKRKPMIILAAEEFMEKFNSERAHYHLTENNCQHFATLVRFGKSFCVMTDMLKEKETLGEVVKVLGNAS